MKNDLRLLPVFFLLLYCCFSTPCFSQSILTNREAEVALFFSPSLSTYFFPKKYRVPYYEGNPHKLKEKKLFFFNPALYIEQTNKEKKGILAFEAARFYAFETILDTVELNEQTSTEEYINNFGFPPEAFIGDNRVQVRKMKQEWVNRYFQPFYFKKWEVTNAEYRSFVNYVIKSQAHLLLGQVNSDGKPDRKQKIDWSDPRLKPLFPRLDHKVNPEKLEYTYEVEGAQRRVLIYPDTACWTNDWVFSYNKPMTKNYFAHQVFNGYPVVGINYDQAQAFCHWKTQQLNQQYPKGPRLKG